MAVCSGIATFTDLPFNAPGVGHTLPATVSGGVPDNVSDLLCRKAANFEEKMR
jgi:hypothetical protein